MIDLKELRRLGRKGWEWTIGFEPERPRLRFYCEMRKGPSWQINRLLVYRAAGTPEAAVRGALKDMAERGIEDNVPSIGHHLGSSPKQPRKPRFHPP